MGLKIIDKIIDRFEEKQKLKAEVKRAEEFSANKKVEQFEIFQTLVLLYSQSNKVVQSGTYGGWNPGPYFRFCYPTDDKVLCEVHRENITRGYNVDVFTPGSVFAYNYGTIDEFHQPYAEQLYKMFETKVIPSKLYLKTLLYDVIKHK